MPNTLVHAGVQGFVSRTAWSDGDLKWVYLGCIIPDLPWILQRAAHVVVPGIDPFALRSYVIVQASLLGCLLCSAAVALLARKAWRVFLLLGGNAVLHLGLDAMQTKWGNGVTFLAPITWEPVNWGFFWPESIPTYVLTAFGLVYITWNWQQSASNAPGLTWPSISRLVGILVLLGGYFLGPLLLHHHPVEADAHSLKTLGEIPERTGRPVEIDRARYVHEQNGYFLDYFGGRVRVEKLGAPEPAMVSIRGVFVDNDTVRVTNLHVHAGGFRDYPSYLGVVLIVVLWCKTWYRKASVVRNYRSFSS